MADIPKGKYLKTLKVNDTSIENDDYYTIEDKDVVITIELADIIKKYTVKFDSNGGSIVEDQTVAEGTTVKRPVDPKRDGYVFKAWYRNGLIFNNKEYDFTESVTSNFTLKAKWEKAADYSAVDEALKKVPSDLSNYTYETAGEVTMT